MKLTWTGGCLGSILTTLLSTFGGGLKLFLPTLRRWLTLARSCVFTVSLQYKDSLGLATSLMANSRWNIRMAARNRGRWLRSLKVSGEEI